MYSASICFGVCVCIAPVFVSWCVCVCIAPVFVSGGVCV